MEAKLKHLEFIQSAIARMSNASFLFKGWSITIAGALFVFAIVNNKAALVAIAILSTILFWGLDGYYLWLERGFIALYYQVAALSPSQIDFSMYIDKEQPENRWLKTCVRPHLLAFYGVIIVLELIGIFVVKE